ncbi:ligand-binding sensor domain-containing protein [Maribellus sediminis]|uniref:ligand-binding sensor domain-containing protein n=1 Tax=Maribellus sediminis TaxID=2696285 RepID=UPI001430A43A|nr:two-component regulator propeller domain-containing protein [Maribellus sediminis]
MKKFFQLIYLILFLTLNFSCVEKKTSEKEISKSESVSTSKTDTLKFTSGIRVIFQDSKGNYWLGSHEEGVNRFNWKAFEYFTTSEGLSDNQIRSIQEDNNGTIWFGTASGVSSYDARLTEGHKITNHTLFVNEFSPNNRIKTANDLWFNAGNNAGLYRYDGQKINYLAFPEPENANPDNRYYPTSIAEGKNDMLWIGTYPAVFGFNGHQFAEVITDETLGLNEETGHLHVRSVFEDSKGRLWIGNNGIGVLLKAEDSIINFSEQYNLIHPASIRSGAKSPAGTLEHVFAIEEDADGNIWFGDRDTGAWKYDGTTMTNYVIDKKLKSQMIWSIYTDNDNNLLLGMAEGGVYRFNGKSFDKRF